MPQRGFLRRVLGRLLLGASIGTGAAIAQESPSALLAGRYDNRAQVDALPDTVSREPARRGDWVDLQAAEFHRVTGTPLAGDVVYLQWHRADGTVSRQRLWAFRTLDDNTVAMDFYSFREPGAWVDLQTDTARQAELGPDDLVSYPDGCTLAFRPVPGGWAGALNPQTCSIVAQRSGRDMALESWVVITGDALWYRERGEYANGDTAFEVPGTGHYVFQRR